MNSECNFTATERKPGSLLLAIPGVGQRQTVGRVQERKTLSAHPLGLIGLFGIAVQNGLVLASSFEAAIREASIGRVRQKSMTAATAILGLLPILLLRLHGTEIERPLAIVMAGGLITSTLFTLLALPTFYLFVHSSRKRYAANPTDSLEFSRARDATV
ncbi:MAG: efflux RND transporter permease subunit [Candidatus Angelobacter sp.]